MVTELVIVLTLLCSPSLVKAEEFLHEVDRSKWVDPHDFGSEKFVNTKYVPEDTSHPVLSCPEPVHCAECARERQHLEAELKDCKLQSQGPDAKPYFAQFVREMTTALKKSETSSDDMYLIKVHLTSDQLSFLQSLDSHTASLKPSHLQDATAILVGMIQSVQPYNETKTYSQILDTLQEYTGMSLNFIVQVLTACALVLMCVYFIAHISLPWMKLLQLVVIIIFVVSFVWTWYHLYKKEVAKRNAEMNKHKDIPLECDPDNISLAHSIRTWVSSWYTISEDKCAKFHELLVVHPMLEVPPTKALAVTFTRFVVEPFQHIGEGINKFFVALVQGLPLPLIGVVLAFLFIWSLLWCGYTISVPFLLSLRPRERPPIEARELHQLTEELHQVRNLLAVRQASEIHTSSHTPSVYFTDLRHSGDTTSQQACLCHTQVDNGARTVSSEGAQVAVKDGGSGDHGNMSGQEVVNDNTVALNSHHASDDRISNSANFNPVQADSNHDVESIGMKKT